MKVRFSQVEAFNFPDVVPNEAAQRFLAQVPPGEEFEFPGEKRPKSLLITAVEFSGPRSGFAKGLLLSVNIDTFDAVTRAEAGPDGSFDSEQIISRYCLSVLDLRLEPVCNVTLVPKAL